jgi:hypothetical protein
MTETPARWARDLVKVDHAQRPYELFRDFAALAYHAHAKTTALTAPAADAHEAAYMETVSRNKPETVRSLPELMARAVAAVQDGGQDFLGVAASELGTLSPDHLGQVFTPYELSRLTAEMTLSEAADEAIASKGYITIQEPAAGAGSMLIAAADVLTARGHDPSTAMLAQAIELSPLCYHLCYLQLTWRGIPAAVIHGNTLTLEQFSSAWTPAALLQFLPAHGHLGHATPAAEPPEIAQLPLF